MTKLEIAIIAIVFISAPSKIIMEASDLTTFNYTRVILFDRINFNLFYQFRLVGIELISDAGNVRVFIIFAIFAMRIVSLNYIQIFEYGHSEKLLDNTADQK